MSKVYDGFIFYNELEILDIRLEELYPVVDHFIIIESNKTFRGADKPYYFTDNLDRYEKYADKIIVTHLYDTKDFGDDNFTSWKREAWQRNYIAESFRLHHKYPDDILIISDVDEIPRRSVVETLPNIEFDKAIPLQMDGFVYKLNLYGCSHYAAKVVHGRDLANSTPEEIRYIPPENAIDDAGWHFSSLGDAEFISNKFKSFAHWEIDKPEYTDVDRIQYRIDNAIDPIDRGGLQRVDVTDRWPEAVKNNLEYWSKYIA